MKKLLVFLLVLIFASYAGHAQIITIAKKKSSEYTALNPSSGTEVDPGTYITVTSSSVSWANIFSRDDTGYVYNDLGSEALNGDFTFRFIAKVSYVESNSLASFFMLTKKVSDFRGIDAGSAEDDDAISFAIYDDGSEAFRLYSCEDGSTTNDQANFTTSIDVNYYVTITRDDSENTVTAYICTTAYCTDGANLQDTLTKVTTEQNDFRYIFWFSTYDDTSNPTADTSGSTTSLEYKLSL